MCLYQEGRWNEAEKALLQVMATRRGCLGRSIHTLISMANLASTYNKNGRWNEAKTGSASDGDEQEGAPGGASHLH